MLGEPACAWMMSAMLGFAPDWTGLLSKSSDFESRNVRKLIASMPFDSAGMIWHELCVHYFGRDHSPEASYDAAGPS